MDVKIKINKMTEKHDVNGLVKMLSRKNDGDKSIRWEALRALYKLKDLYAVEPLVDMLGDYRPDVRKAAADMLAGLGETKWKEIIKGDDGDFERLGKAGDVRVTGALIDALKNLRVCVIEAAVKALREFRDPRAVRPLLLAMDKTYIEARSTLHKYADDPLSLDAIIKSLNDKNVYLRFHAADILREISNPRVVEPLIKALNDKNYNVSAYSLEALENLRTNAEINLPDWVNRKIEIYKAAVIRAKTELFLKRR